MPNYAFKEMQTPLGELSLYVAGTTSTTLIASKIISISDLVYDFSSTDKAIMGSLTLSVDNGDGQIDSVYSSIKSEIWILEIDGTEYFRGKPRLNSLKFDKKKETFSLQLLAMPIDDKSYDDTTITTVKVDTWDYYPVSHWLNNVFFNAIGIGDNNGNDADVVFDVNDVEISSIPEDVEFEYSTGNPSWLMRKPSSHLQNRFINLMNWFNLNFAIWKGKVYVWERGRYFSSTYTVSTNIISLFSWQDYTQGSYFGSLSVIKETTLGFTTGELGWQLLGDSDRFFPFNSTSYASSGWSTSGTYASTDIEIVTINTYNVVKMYANPSQSPFTSLAAISASVTIEANSKYRISFNAAKKSTIVNDVTLDIYTSGGLVESITLGASDTNIGVGSYFEVDVESHKTINYSAFIISMNAAEKPKAVDSGGAQQPIYFWNVSIAKIEEKDLSVESIPKSEGQSVLDIKPYSGTAFYSATERLEATRQSLAQQVTALENRFGNEFVERIEGEVKGIPFYPYTRITYDSTNYLIDKFAVNFTKGTTKFTATEI